MFASPKSTAIALILLAFSAASAQSPVIGNCTVLPADNIWNTPVDQLPVFAGSAAVVGPLADVLPVDLHIRGCPPLPLDIVKGLLALIEARG